MHIKHVLCAFIFSWLLRFQMRFQRSFDSITMLNVLLWEEGVIFAHQNKFLKLATVPGELDKYLQSERVRR